MKKNRLTTPLGFLKILIIDADGQHQFDPNSLLMATFQGELFYLKPTDTKSILSGNPAVTYMSQDISVPLTIDELVRLVTLNLKPREYRKLVSTYGIAHEWHSDFYAENGYPIQPKEMDEDFIKQIKRDAALKQLDSR
jgi:hypothetical protein